MILYENIEACLILGSYMDTIGYNNGKYEFNFNENIFTDNDAYDMWIRIITDFFSNEHDISKMKSSDDTIMMIHTGFVMLNDNIQPITFINQYIKAYKDLIKKERGNGNRLMASLEYFNKFGIKGYNDKYMDTGGGNGAAMRAATIGIRFYNNIDKIMDYTISDGKITHNNPYGYLGSMCVGLMISYAINMIDPKEWIKNILEIYNNNIHFKKIKQQILSKEHSFEFNNFFVILEQFQNRNIVENKLEQKEIFNIMKKYEPAYDNNDYSVYGQSGLGLIIAVMFCILNCVKYNKKKYIVNFKKSLIFSSLCFGDSDTIGMIVGNIIGIMSGYKYIKNINFKKLEFYDEIKLLSKKIYKKIF